MTTTNIDRFAGLAPIVDAHPSAAALVERLQSARAALNALSALEYTRGGEKVRALRAAADKARAELKSFLVSVGDGSWAL